MGKNRKYSAELKLRAVKAYLEGEKGSTAIAKELNLVSGRMLRRWVAIYQKHGENGFIDKRGLSKNNKGRPKKNFNSLEEELKKWIIYYNTERIQKRLNYLSPIEYKKAT